MATRKTSTETSVKNILVPVIQNIVRSGKLWYLILGLVILFLGYKLLTRSGNETTITDSAVIEKKIKNVGKLVVTEGHFAEVLTYKDQKKYLMDLINFEKKALIVANADVTVAYDLHLLEYDLNEAEKIVTLVKIPEAEVKVYPSLEFYDVNQSRFNPFTGEDYNKINAKVKADFEKKIQKSSLKKNAENRLITELSKILILTNSMGWKLEYKGKIMDEKNLGKIYL